MGLVGAWHRTSFGAARKRHAQVLVCVAVAILGGVGGWFWYSQVHRDDGYLRFYGTTTGSVLAPGHVDPGKVLGFAFPQIHNAAASPMTLRSLELRHLPEGATVVTYRFLSAQDVGSVLLGSFPVDQKGREGYEQYPDYDAPVVPAHSDSDYYGVVYLRVPGPLTGHASGCVVNYTVAGRDYSQQGDCDFMLQNARHALLHGD